LTEAVNVLQNSGVDVFEAEFQTKSNPARVLIGRRVNHIPEDTCFGRTKANEMLEGKYPRGRQIDHRELHYIIHKTVKYNTPKNKKKGKPAPSKKRPDDPVTQSRDNTSIITEGNLCNSKDLRVGDKFSTTMYYSFEGAKSGDRSDLLNEADSSIYTMDNKIIAKNFY